MHEDIKREAEKGMKKAITSLQHELAGIRTGRASVALLDGIKVDYYGSMAPVKQVANISVPESRLIAIQPYQPDMFPMIQLNGPVDFGIYCTKFVFPRFQPFFEA